MLIYKDWRQKKANTCGPTCVRLACAALGSRYTEEFLEERLLCSNDDGTEPSNIAAFLRSEGFAVLDGNMEVVDLNYFTKNGRPVIALCDSHYVAISKVFRGRVYFQDPTEGPRSLTTEQFNNYWNCESYLGVPFKRWAISLWRP